jgi:hypothetical protein
MNNNWVFAKAASGGGQKNKSENAATHRSIAKV